MAKYLDRTGLARLWAAIEAKFVDNEEIEELLSEVEPGTTIEALTNAEIDAVTGYVEPETPQEGGGN